MLAKNWKRIGLIILIIACFANITSKFVKKVSFNDNVKSTVSNVVNTVDGTVQNVVDSVTSNQNSVQDQNLQSVNTVVENTTNNTFIIQEIN